MLVQRPASVQKDKYTSSGVNRGIQDVDVLIRLKQCNVQGAQWGCRIRREHRHCAY